MEDLLVTKINNLPPHIQPYLLDINKILERYVGFENVNSVILFGSYARGEYTSNSDCDILIILKDDFYKRKSKRFFNNLEKLFMFYERKHGLKFEKRNIISSILSFVEKSTGMFTSHFMCRESYWKKQKFNKIFNVNRMMAKFLAPGDIVLKNMGSSYLNLFGKLPEAKFKEEISLMQLIKSFFMNELISVGTIAIYPFLKASTQYSLESFKWAIRNSYLYLFNEPSSLKNIMNFFKDKALKPSVIKKYMHLRHHYSNDIHFVLGCPYYCLKIHDIAIRYRKLIRNGKK